MAYPRNCIRCGQLITMSELSPGRWQPWEPDGSGRHQCGSGRTRSIHQSRSLTALISNAETYLTRCPWCPQHVYYHTSGYGDCVYFDSLGYPWQVHACWEKYWKDKKDRQRVLNHLLSKDTLDRQKLLILAGVLRTVRAIGTEEQTLYAIHETTLAQRLGISIARLKTDYGHLYQPEAHGIKLRSKAQPQIAPLVPPVTTGSISSKLIGCKHCGKLIWESQSINCLKASYSCATIHCSNCGEVRLERSLQKHLGGFKPKKQHKKSKKRKKSRTVLLNNPKVPKKPPSI